MNFPKDLKYTEDHEWAKVQGTTITVGITDHAQSALGDIVFLELPKVGKELKKGDTFGVVESVKAVSDLYSPVAGKVVEIHEDLANDPGQINSDPYGAGWLVKIQVADASAMSGLMDSGAYQKHVQSLG